MGTKQVQMSFSVFTNPGETSNAIIFVDDVQKYNGPLSDGSNGSDVVTFDLDVVDQPIPTYIKPVTPGQWVTPVAISVTIENGTATLLYTKANYTSYLIDNESIYVVGSSTDYQTLCIASQPLWNGVADLSRYDFANTNPEFGALLIQNNETVTFQLSMTQWADE